MLSVIPASRLAHRDSKLVKGLFQKTAVAVDCKTNVYGGRLLFALYARLGEQVWLVRVLYRIIGRLQTAHTDSPWTRIIPNDRIYFITKTPLVGLGSGGGTALLLLLGALLLALRNQLGVLVGSLAGGLQAGNLVGNARTLALQNNRRDQTLDLGALDGRLLAFLLGWNDATNNVLTDIVVLGQVEQLADLAGTLRSQTTGNRGIGQTGQRLVASLDNHQRQHRQVSANNATTDRLAAAVTRAALAEASVSLGQQEAGSVVQQDTLLHRETLLVVTSGDADDVSLELVTKSIDGDLLGHALVVEDAQLALVVNLNELLAASGRVGNVQLQESCISMTVLNGLKSVDRWL